MKIISALGLAAILATSSLANATSFGSADGALVRQVSITFTRSVIDAKQVSPIRKEIYESALGECDILSETFKADCELTSLSLSEYPQVAGATVLSLTATASYQLSSPPADNASSDKANAN